MAAATIEEDLRVLDLKLNQLKLDYERYFLGTRPREPILLKGEVQKLIVVLSNTSIQNTALRFRFSSINSRYQSFKRRWNETLRQMDQGTYTRHRFKADLHDRERSNAAAPEPAGGAAAAPASAPAESENPLFSAYIEARRQCGQPIEGLTPARLQAVIAKQQTQLQARFGDDDFRFRVIVEDGRAKLKAARVQNSG